MKTIKILFADDDLKILHALKTFFWRQKAMKLLTQETEALPYNNFP